ncbi:hypothetical protein MAR_002575 [Mya arenaria]|uniref:Uncharacterized protein n=1 Tax=Mya arenaria TaxID=6604 RepID=A0ABY7G6P9_MYAAR|nr:hypothetical protein MAR_002575 [Mya arenaria]
MAYIETISKSPLEKNNSKEWWSFVKQVMSSSSSLRSIPPLLVNSEIIHSNKAKANALNTFLTTQTFLEEPNTEPFPPTYNISPILSMYVYQMKR